MSEREDSKITWITCPECGAKIGVVLSVGKIAQGSVVPQPQEAGAWPPMGIGERLVAAGIDLTLIDINEGEEVVTVRPKKFLGDLWGPVNDAVKSLGGMWIRDGRESRWEIRKEEES